MAKFKKVEGTKGTYKFICPGCNTEHLIWTANEGHQHPVWGFNGDLDKPTITPSIRVQYPANPEAKEEYKEWRKERICHSFIKGGIIQFLGDCTHELRGQTVEIPEFKE